VASPTPDRLGDSGPWASQLAQALEAARESASEALSLLTPAGGLMVTRTMNSPLGLSSRRSTEAALQALIELALEALDEAAQATAELVGLELPDASS
jgi:hypothetical protein